MNYSVDGRGQFEVGQLHLRPRPGPAGGQHFSEPRNHQIGGGRTVYIPGGDEPVKLETCPSCARIAVFRLAQ